MHEISVSGIRVYINKADPVQLRRLLKEDVVMLVYVGEVEETVNIYTKCLFNS
jgi:hypothetical protein